MAIEIDRTGRVQASARIFIAAPPLRVWSVLTDLQSWPEWNKDVITMKVDGPLAPGTEFTWKAGGLVIRSRLEEVKVPSRIAWTGRMLGVSAIHVWTLEPVADGTQVTTEESFGGFLPRLLPGLMRRTLEKALSQGLQMLKARCEKTGSEGPVK